MDFKRNAFLLALCVMLSCRAHNSVAQQSAAAEPRLVVNDAGYAGGQRLYIILDSESGREYLLADSRGNESPALVLMAPKDTAKGGQ